MRYFENISKNRTYNHHERIFQMSKNNNKAIFVENIFKE